MLAPESKGDFELLTEEEVLEEEVVADRPTPRRSVTTIETPSTRPTSAANAVAERMMRDIPSGGARAHDRAKWHRLQAIRAEFVGYYKGDRPTATPARS